MVFVEGNIVKAVIKASAIKTTRGKGKKKKSDENIEKEKWNVRLNNQDGRRRDGKQAGRTQIQDVCYCVIGG